MEAPLIKTLDTSIFLDEKTFNDAYLSVSPERRKKVDGYRFSKDKMLSLGAGILFENTLKELNIKKYSISFNEHKKPYLTGCGNLFFSLSHSGTYSACAFFDREIGIDIEKIDEASDSLIKRVTTKSEYEYLMSLDEKNKKEQFTRLWTVKESYMKYEGTGLSLAPKTLEASLGEKITITYNGKPQNVIFYEQNIDGYKMTACVQYPSSHQLP